MRGTYVRVTWYITRQHYPAAVPVPPDNPSSGVRWTNSKQLLRVRRLSNVYTPYYRIVSSMFRFYSFRAQID